MMRGRAIFAVVRARLYVQRRAIGNSCATAIVASFIQPHGIEAITDPLIANLATRSVWIAGPIFFCSALGVIAALLQGPGRYPDLDICEISAPLYGRELARAKSLTPCLIAIFTAFVYWIAQWLRGFAAPPSYFGLAIVTVLATTLIALSATVRTGSARLLYLILAAAVASGCYALAVYADSIFTGVVFAIVVGFVALRQYGEAHARYDPVS